MMDGHELKPCPFCGGIPRIDLAKKKYCQLHGEPSQRVRVYCYHDCAARPSVEEGDVYSGGEAKARADAVAAWNTRFPTGHVTVPALIPADWPTNDMIRAAEKVEIDYKAVGYSGCLSWEELRAIGKAMLAAALTSKEPE